MELAQNPFFIFLTTNNEIIQVQAIPREDTDDRLLSPYIFSNMEYVQTKRETSNSENFIIFGVVKIYLQISKVKIVVFENLTNSKIHMQIQYINFQIYDETHFVS